MQGRIGFTIMAKNVRIICRDGQAFTLPEFVGMWRTRTTRLFKGFRSAVVVVAEVTMSFVALPALTSNASTDHDGSNLGFAHCQTTTTYRTTTTTTTTTVPSTTTTTSTTPTTVPSTTTSTSSTTTTVPSTTSSTSSTTTTVPSTTTTKPG